MRAAESAEDELSGAGESAAAASGFDLGFEGGEGALEGSALPRGDLGMDGRGLFTVRALVGGAIVSPVRKIESWASWWDPLGFRPVLHPCST